MDGPDFPCSQGQSQTFRRPSRRPWGEDCAQSRTTARPKMSRRDQVRRKSSRKAIASSEIQQIPRCLDIGRARTFQDNATCSDPTSRRHALAFPLTSRCRGAGRKREYASVHYPPRTYALFESKGSNPKAAATPGCPSNSCESSYRG